MTEEAGKPRAGDAGRRTFLRGSAALVGGAMLEGAAAGSAAPAIAAATPAAAARPKVRRIATEEAFTTPAIAAATTAYMAGAGRNEEPALAALRASVAPQLWQEWGRRLIDMGPLRAADMAASRIDAQLLVPSSPGVQIFPADQAIELARGANDYAAALCRAEPARYAALAAIAPQAPRAAADELTRAVRTLGFKGALINSHTKGEYLDNPKFRPILETAQALDVPIYIHPREPAPAMAGPFAELRLLGSIWGFAAETGLHALRMILAGVFDDFPRLQIVLGHAGEGLPFFVDRIDTRYAVELVPGGAKRLRHPPSHYLRNNFAVTTSGMNWNLPIRLCIEVMGVERVMFAADYPFENTIEATRTFDQAKLGDDEYRRVCQTNAERIFRMKESEEQNREGGQ